MPTSPSKTCNQRLPVVLVTGFLGSGKTTLLKELLQRYQGKRLVWLINEFGEVDIDGQVLSPESDEIVSIPGGSIFCRCLVTEFMRVLSAVAAASDSSQPFEGVVIEASGIANPRVTDDLFKETGLDADFQITNIVSVVDPGTFEKLLTVLPNISAQVEASDLILLNKTDLYEESQLQPLLDRVRELNPTAEIRQTRYCQLADKDLFALDHTNRCGGEMAKCRDPNYSRVVISWEDPVQFDSLRQAIEVNHTKAYRIKGFVRSTTGWVRVDAAAADYRLEPCPEETDLVSQLVVIAAPDAAGELAREIKAMTRSDCSVPDSTE